MVIYSTLEVNIFKNSLNSSKEILPRSGVAFTATHPLNQSLTLCKKPAKETFQLPTPKTKYLPLHMIHIADSFVV